ncbi:MAG: GatB/YqeY domain-containing protein [Planktomarina sp.]
MDLRTRLTTAMKAAMKAKAADRLGTLRLINAAIKDRDIDARAKGKDAVGDDDVLALLAKMVKQRQESARVYEEGGRLELAEKELSEIVIVEEFLPTQLDDAQTEVAIKEAIAESGASSIRDMGKVMSVLKAKYTGQLDFGKVGGVVKAQLG